MKAEIPRWVLLRFIQVLQCRGAPFAQGGMASTPLRSKKKKKKVASLPPQGPVEKPKWKQLPPDPTACPLERQ